MFYSMISSEFSRCQVYERISSSLAISLPQLVHKAIKVGAGGHHEAPDVRVRADDKVGDHVDNHRKTVSVLFNEFHCGRGIDAPVVVHEVVGEISPC